MSGKDHVRALALGAVMLAGCGGGAESIDATVATVSPIRTGVTNDGETVSSTARLAPGGVVATEGTGLARVELDGGAWLLLGSESRVVVDSDSEVELVAGRIFVMVEPGDERLRLRTASGVLGTNDGALSAEMADGGARVYVVRGEVGYGGAGHGVVRAGQEVRLAGGEAAVAPVAAWRDWTGGIARSGPTDRSGPAGVGTLEARLPGESGTARRPLVVRRLDVRVRVQGDLAITEVDQVFWNPATTTVEGLYRMRTPEDAVLQRFAIDRNGRLADAYVREREQARAGYESQVYAGSTDDPALLEWDAPGAFRARIYPIGPGETRRIVVRYAEWLVRPSSGAPRLYSYPMASEGRPPVVEDFSLEVDLSEAGAGRIRTGLGAAVVDGRVVLRRTDFRPQADFWLEMADRERPDALSAYRAPHQPPRRAPNVPAPEGEANEADYFFLPLVLPVDLAGETETGAGRDVVVVLDVSAATDPSHLELGQSVVEAIAEHLGPADRLAVVASDLSLRPVGGEAGTEGLGPASPERVEALLSGLARVAAGGATDLGRAITAAGDLLEPDRPSAVVYVGDGIPTVGELGSRDLVERMTRLPSTARLYAVAVGANARLDLLAALSSARGLAIRVEERRAGAEAALEILAHLSRPMAREVTVELGDGIENVYPSGEASALLGRVLPVVGRTRGRDLPTTVRVTGTVGGRAFETEVPVRTVRVEDGGDLRARWATERLLRLLDEGVPRETIVELGTRYGLVTPYTSFYVPSARELARSGAWSGLLEPLDVGPGRRRGGRAPLALALREMALGPLTTMGCQDRAAPAGEPAESASPPQPLTAQPVAPPPPAREEMAESLARSVEAPTEPTADRRAPAASGVASTPSAPAPAGTTDGLAATSARPASDDALGAVARRGRHAPSGAELEEARPAEAPRAHLAPSSRPGAAEPEAPIEDERRLEARAPAPATQDVQDGDGEAEETSPPAPDEAAAAHRPRRCSPAAGLPLNDRAALWLERLQSDPRPVSWARVYRRAVGLCEAPSWRDRQVLLDLMVAHAGSVSLLVEVHRTLAGTDARPYLERAMLERVRNPADMGPVRHAFGGADAVDWIRVEPLLADAGSPEERVRVLRRFVEEHPRSLDLRVRLLAALEEAGRVPEARRMLEVMRSNRLADAETRTALGELVLRQGDETEARRLFSEMVEFAPFDALARRRLGNLYRAHGWWEDAYRQYRTLAELQPDDPSVVLLLAAAAAGAGRVDEALRLEQRLVESPEPGRTGGLGRAALLLSSVRFARLRKEARDSGETERMQALLSRMRRSAILREASALRVSLVWAHPHANLQLWAGHPGSAATRPRDLWPELGIEVFDVEDLEDGEYRVEVRRAGPALHADVDAELVVVWREGEGRERIDIVPLRFDRGRLAYAWTIVGDELRESEPSLRAVGEVL